MLVIEIVVICGAVVILAAIARVAYMVGFAAGVQSKETTCQKE